jgi:hypothetical protein
VILLGIWSKLWCSCDLFQLDLYPDHMILDQECVRDIGGFIEVISNSSNDEDLDLVCREARALLKSA